MGLKLKNSVVVIELYERLQGKLSNPVLRQSSVGNLGGGYSQIGQTQKAITCYEQALVINLEIGNRSKEGTWLSYIAYTLADQGKWDEAIRQYNQVIQIDDEIGNVQLQNVIRYGIALARLYLGDLPAARVAVEAARQYEFLPNRHNILALLGLIALRQGDWADAQEAFKVAVAQADALLSHSAQYYNALDAKGLALCGLTLCERNSEHIPTAIKAYRTARAINRDAGGIGHVLRLFDALALADSAGVLAGVRDAAGGK